MPSRMFLSGLHTLGVLQIEADNEMTPTTFLESYSSPQIVCEGKLLALLHTNAHYN